MFAHTDGALPPQWGADAPECLHPSVEEMREFNGSRHARRGTPVALWCVAIPETSSIPLGAWAVKEGEFVTVWVEQEGKRPIATRIAVTVTAE